MTDDPNADIWHYLYLAWTPLAAVFGFMGRHLWARVEALETNKADEREVIRLAVMKADKDSIEQRFDTLEKRFDRFEDILDAVRNGYGR